MYSVYQHWDKLKTCVVGRSYPPEFYSYITNLRVRKILERIAIETEEDYQKLIKLLESFNVKIIRPNISNDFEKYLFNGKYIRPPMYPRDEIATVGTQCFVQSNVDFYDKIIEDIKKNNVLYMDKFVNTAYLTRVGKDLYVGTGQFHTVEINKNITELKNKKISLANLKRSYLQKNEENYKRMVKLFPNYRVHMVNTEGHNDGCFCPIVTGLIASLIDIQKYSKTFPKWEVIYLKDNIFTLANDFLKVRDKNDGKWWVQGEELNDEFTDFVESWLNNWVGFVEETVFDINMLVIDKNNVICNNYNEKLFKKLEKFNVTPHILNFRHRYFWDCGLHCITSDLDREGVLEDYFPERGEPGEHIPYLGR